MSFTPTPVAKMHALTKITLFESDDHVTNGNMELDSDWNTWGTGVTVVRSAEQAHSGTYSRKVTFDANGNKCGTIQEITGLTIGTSYRVSAWFRGLDVAAKDFKIYFDGERIREPVSNGTWVELSNNYVATDTTFNLALLVEPTKVANANKSFYVDDVSVKEMVNGETEKILYYADESMSMSDGNFYDGRLGVSTLQRAFSSFTAPKQRDSTLTITLKDNDLTIREMLELYTWGNRHVKVYIGKGRNLDDYSIDFHGIVKFPGGIGFDRNEVRIKLRDVRNRDKVTLPINKFWISNYPNLEDGEEAKPIPIVYGSFSDTPIPATCIDTTTNQFKIADNPMFVVKVYKNGEETEFSDENVNEATFKIEEYTPGTDVVTVGCYAYLEFLCSPTNVLKDLLENYIGVSSSDIDTDSFDELAGEQGGTYVRRYIANEISSDTLIEELAIENMFDLFIANDKYTVKSRMPKMIIDKTFDNITIMPGTLSVESDPESLYANRIKCNYKYDPVNEEYLGFYQEDNVAEQGKVNQVISRTIDFNWLYEYDAVHAVAAHLILLYSHEIDVIRFTALGDGILTQLADRAGLTFAHYNNRPLHVREISKHFKTMSCTIFGYDSIKHVLPGYWTADDAPNYGDATEDQKKSMGFWTDDEGRADPEDEESKISNWW